MFFLYKVYFSKEPVRSVGGNKCLSPISSFFFLTQLDYCSKCEVYLSLIDFTLFNSSDLLLTNQRILLAKYTSFQNRKKIIILQFIIFSK